jgi:hypothetical protein
MSVALAPNRRMAHPAGMANDTIPPAKKIARSPICDSENPRPSRYTPIREMASPYEMPTSKIVV